MYEYSKPNSTRPEIASYLANEVGPADSPDSMPAIRAEMYQLRGAVESVGIRVGQLIDRIHPVLHQASEAKEMRTMGPVPLSPMGSELRKLQSDLQQIEGALDSAIQRVQL